MKLRNLLIAACAALLLMMAGCEQQAQPSDGTPPNPVEKEGYNLIFQDEFDGETLDIDKWLPQYFPHSTTDAAACQTTYRMEDGKLVLYLDENTPCFFDGTEMKVSSIQTYEKNHLHPNTPNVTNVMPYDSFTCQYGYFEIRLKMPNCGGGGHVAWWLVGAQDDARADGTMSSQNGEIDIVETSFEYPNVFSPKVHAFDDPDLAEYKDSVGLEGNFTDEYHIYAMNWTPEGITFYFDGKEICKTNQSPQYRMGMLLGIYTDSIGFTGAHNDVWPKEFYIDYIRVYQDKNGYPNGTTKPATPVVLPQDSAEQMNSMMFGDMELAQPITNLLASANMTLIGEEAADLSGLTDNNYKHGYVSPDDVALPKEFVFSWDEPVSGDTLRLVSNCAVGQAPTYMEILTKSGDGEWVSAVNCTVTWITISDSLEYIDIPVPGDNITDLKIIVRNANLEWKHYVIIEALYFAENGGESGENIISSVIAEDSGILENNIATQATVTIPEGTGRLVSDLVNGSHVEGYVSEDNPELPQDILFTFNEGKTVSGVRISGNCSLGQAPTKVEISVKVNGEYISLGDYTLVWQSKTLPHEYCDILFDAMENVEEVKITIKQAWLEWKHYSIQEIQIY